jgi:hypothetical protein
VLSRAKGGAISPRLGNRYGRFPLSHRSCGCGVDAPAKREQRLERSQVPHPSRVLCGRVGITVSSLLGADECGPITQRDHEPASRWYSIVLCYVCARHVPSSHSRAFVQSAGLGCAPAKHALWTSPHPLPPESKPCWLQEQPVGLWSSLPRQAMHRLASALPRFFPVIPFDLLSTGFFRLRSCPPVRFCARRVSFVTTVTRIYQFSIDCAYFPELVPG